MGGKKNTGAQPYVIEPDSSMKRYFNDNSFYTTDRPLESSL